MKKDQLHIVVLSSQRSGSTWLIDELFHRVQSAATYSEVFLDRPGACSGNPEEKQVAHLLPEVSWPAFKEEVCGSRIKKVRTYLDYLKRDEPRLIFKLMDNQITPAIAVNLIAKRFKLIYLERKSLLEQLVSSKQAKATGIAHSGSPVALPATVHIEPEEVIQRIRTALWRRRKRNIIWALWPFEKVKLDYEWLEIADNFPAKFLNERLECGLVEERSGSSLRKLDSRPLAEKLSNYSEVVDSLAANGLLIHAVPES